MHDPHTGQRTFTFLGTGTSMGVPMLGCDCRVCTSANPKNHRYRCSVLIRTPRGNILIDTTPELRLQLLRENVKIVHAVVYTHYHVDHLYGLDDLRIFPVKLHGPLPIFCTDEVEAVIRQAFGYAFDPVNDGLPMGMVPRLEPRRIDERPFEVLGELFTPIPLHHGKFNVLGFRVGNVAYCTDVSAIPERSWPLLEDLEVLIIDALRPGKPHPAHFSLEQALETIARLRPHRAYLTHMAHTMDYDELMTTLPPGVEPAYDGLKFPF
ncbi:MAG: MBL fold metallo-hydrolase [Gemmataceae bacterium]|nr:MBL fold metallo-hydrolase [Gemmata sp.]MDW8197485.1 MBL fold metallo-hydrolase [Gemmataceae bacterium]